jgi:hypothetical protein
MQFVTSTLLVTAFHFRPSVRKFCGYNVTAVRNGICLIDMICIYLLVTMNIKYRGSVSKRGIKSRASCLKGVSTKWLIYRRLNSYDYLVWQMCIITVHTPKCNCLYLCVEQHQYYALLAWHTSHYFMLLDHVSPIMQIRPSGMMSSIF